MVRNFWAYNFADILFENFRGHKLSQKWLKNMKTGKFLFAKNSSLKVQSFTKKNDDKYKIDWNIG